MPPKILEVTHFNFQQLNAKEKMKCTRHVAESAKLHVVNTQLLVLQFAYQDASAPKVTEGRVLLTGHA